MKISEFSDKYKVSNDTVRYYMDLNLITPQKKGGHYYFDEKCELQLKEILELKEMNFSLQEIKRIFNFKRVGKLTTYQQNNCYQSIYETKLQEINSEIKKLRNVKNRLEDKIESLKSKNRSKSINMGIDLSALSLFSCPVCNHDLILNAKRVERNQVLEGSLNCDCGQRLFIKNGILYTRYAEENGKQIEDDHIEEYLKNTDPDFIDKSYHTLEWMQRQLEPGNLSGKVIMEPGTGYGHFLRQIYNQLPDSSIYICIDNNPKINQYLKQLLELTGKRVKVIFITADLPELPLKENIIDLLIDFTGTSCFSFENEEFLPELLNPYLKDRATYLATFIIYNKFGPNNIVAKPYRKNFTYSYIKDRLLKIGFEPGKEYTLESQTIQKSMGKYEDFAQPGDQIYSYQVQAKKELNK